MEASTRNIAISVIGVAVVEFAPHFLTYLALMVIVRHNRRSNRDLVELRWDDVAPCCIYAIKLVKPPAKVTLSSI